MIPENIWISQDHVKGDFPVVNDTGISPKLSGMASVQRHPTMPMTKRDSLVISGSRLSLISTGSNTNPIASEDKKQTNAHPEMVAGKRRSPKKVKRTDSYKKALNRQSQYDNVDGGATVVVTAEIAKRRVDDKQKYNTLPTNTTAAMGNGESQRKKRHSGNNNNGTAFQRNASQKSGTYPSPDTDEDQRSFQPERKKKSAFKKFKERFISSVRRDRENQVERKGKSKKGKIPQSSSNRGRVRPDLTNSASGFHTPNGASALDHTSQNGRTSKAMDDCERVISQGTPNNSQESVTENSAGKKKGGPGILTTIRQSFRRKQQHTHLRPMNKHLSNDRPSSYTIQPSQLRNTSPKVSDRPVSSPITIPTRSETPERITEEDAIEAEDGITAIFGSIIDYPRSASTCTRGPDRSKLRLEGLRKNRPTSLEKDDNARRWQGLLATDLSPTVETDGFDFADGPIHSDQPTNAESEEGLTFDDVCPDEKQRRIYEVAQRLAALGDKIAAEKQHDSAGSSSEIEGHRVGLNSLERSLIRDLRFYADKEFGKNGTGISINLMPVIKNILSAQDYSSFTHVVRQELSNTTGWDQVAWYTCLIKASVCIAETRVGSVVKNRAKKYFNSVFRPWIESRPNGWESIHEETDVDSELD